MADKISALPALPGALAGADLFAVVHSGTTYKGTLDELLTFVSASVTIANNSVTYAKMQDITATKRVIGRNTAGAGDPEEVTASQVLDWLGTAAQGQILYRNGTTWVLLDPGTSGQYLKTMGPGANPLWASAGTGDVVGPGSSVDNTLVRADGATGKLIQGSGIVVSDNDEISGYKAHINFQTGTTYTLQTSDHGKVIDLSNASAITLTCPTTLPVGFNCTLFQSGAGQVTVSAGTLRHRQSHTKLAGQYALACLVVRANSGGSAAEYIFAGDTTT